jgi:hypothetical protein
MFVGLHVMLAQLTKTEELAISMDEGEAFMKAASNVMRHYSVQTTQKTLDWIAFGGCTIQIYGLRIVAISVNRQVARVEKSNLRQAEKFDEAVTQGMDQRGHVPSHVSQGTAHVGLVIVPDEAAE